MHALSWVMIALYAFMVFKPYKALKAAVANEDWPRGAMHLAAMRRIVSTNLILGLVVGGVIQDGHRALSIGEADRQVVPVDNERCCCQR